MKNLETLIQELCPDGVEFVKLGDVIQSINTGLNPRRFFSLNTPDANNFYVTIREMKNGRIVFNNDTDKINDEALKLCNNRSNLERGDVLFSGTGTIGQIVVLEENPNNWNIKEGLYALKPIQERIVSKFLAYVLRSTQIRKIFLKKALGGTVKSVPMKVLSNIEIPLPPIKVQTEIVRILDKFTSLEAELEAELDCRKRQYEYYRDKLLSFDNVGGQEVEWKKMSEVGTFIRGKRFVRTDIVEEGVPCIHYGDIYTYYGLTATKAKTYLKPEKAEKMKFASKNDVVIVGAGENNMDIGVGVAWLSDEEVAIHDACYIFKSKMNPRFVSHYLRGSNYHLQIKKYVCEGKICSISSKSIGRSLIPVPSLQEQERIATILDRFESLTTSLQSGLPAEITARRQQYEHYRDKLLTFKRKGAA